MKNKTCLICNNEFTPLANSQKYCSTCFTKTCVQCGNQYDARGKFVSIMESKFCSRKCYTANRWQHTGNCKQCGKPVAENNSRYCSSACQKQYWERNSYRLHKKKGYWNKKLLLIETLGGKCVNCGIDDYRVLDINHKDRTKKVRPKDRQYSWQRRLKEWHENIENLELLCANCHRIHTWAQMNYGLPEAIANN